MKYFYVTWTLENGYGVESLEVPKKKLDRDFFLDGLKLKDHHMSFFTSEIGAYQAIVRNVNIAQKYAVKKKGA